MTIPVDRHGGRLGLRNGGGDGDLALRRAAGGGRGGAVGREELLRGVADAGKEVVLFKVQIRILF